MIPYYNDRVCLNVLAGSKENAKEIYKAAEGYVVVGVLSTNYKDIPSAVVDLKEYCEILDNNLSIGLGAGNPNQCYMVAELSEHVPAKHINQVFTAVGLTRSKTSSNTHINALISPTDDPQYVNVATGPLSSQKTATKVSVDTAIAMIKDMGGNAVKLFPLKGMHHHKTLKVVAEACAQANLCLEPTGGLDLDNFADIMTIILDAGVPKVIPHVYSSIIDENNNTRIADVEKLLSIVKTLV